jgi:hypothetical protein
LATAVTFVVAAAFSSSELSSSDELESILWNRFGRNLRIKSKLNLR